MTWKLAVFAVGYVAASLATAAHADDVPIPKAGLWDVTKKAPEVAKGNYSFKECLDGSVDAMLRSLGQDLAEEDCADRKVTRDGKTVTSIANCPLGASKLKAEVTMTVADDSTLHLDVKKHYDPPLFGAADYSRSVDAKYLSACPDGAVPGDVIMPDGKRYNAEVLKQRGMTRRANQ